MTDLGFLDGSAADVAPRLLGCVLERELGGETVRVRITETEAYDQSDPASHSYRGPSARNAVMFGPAGHLYVYFTYGMHYCCNVVTGPPGEGSAVLIRAVDPLEGAGLLEARRGVTGPAATNGPAKLCRALEIDRMMDGHDLRDSPLRLVPQAPLLAGAVTRTTRVGITRGRDTAWRFYETGNRYVSRR